MKTSIKELNSYLVGGAVRDKLLGVVPKDKDYVVVGSSVAEMLHLGFKQVGADFPVFLHPETGDEWALARTEKKTGQGYTGFTWDSSDSVSLKQDLLRRDLTINALAISSTGEVIEPYVGCIDDVHNKVLRHTSAAFSDDPVRVLRVCRLLSRYGEGWTISRKTEYMCDNIVESEEWSHLTAERVWKETEKALQEKHTDKYFKQILYNEAVVNFQWFSELAPLCFVPQPVDHHPEGDVLTHTLKSLEQASVLGASPVEKWAVLCHDLGKAVAYSARGNLYGHEAAGLPPVNSLCDRLKVPNKYRELALKVCEWHTLCHRAFELSPKRIVKLFNDLDAFRRPDQLFSFLLCCEADAKGRGKGEDTTYSRMYYAQKDYLKACYESCLEVDCNKIANEVRCKDFNNPGQRIKQLIHQARIKQVKRCIK